MSIQLVKLRDGGYQCPCCMKKFVVPKGNHICDWDPTLLIKATAETMNNTAPPAAKEESMRVVTKKVTKIEVRSKWGQPPSSDLTITSTEGEEEHYITIGTNPAFTVTTEQLLFLADSIADVLGGAPCQPSSK